MRKRIALGPTQFDCITLNQAVAAIVTCALEMRTPSPFVVTPNLDHLQRLDTDHKLSESYSHAEFSLADGMPCVWLSRLAGTPLPERVSGADLLPALCKVAGEQKLRIYLLGGGKGIASRAAENISKDYPGIQCEYYYPPFGFESDPTENARIIEHINQFQPHFLFVGVGSPKQENWIISHRQQLKVGIALGIGTTIEFMAGNLKRAPVWMQRCGLEWFFRLLMEPRRLATRYASNFIYLIQLSLYTIRDSALQKRNNMAN
jgi:N-acetylglucosaminyldiphosphoundecaprenol N-acetyl-beta-D-mannosaminyltransferase